MNDSVQRHIASALAAVEKYLAVKESKDTVPKEYDGYAASFTASVVTSGLLPTLSFFTDIHKSDKDKEPRRYRITQALMHILHPIEGEGKHEKNKLLLYAVGRLYGDGSENAGRRLDNMDEAKLPVLQREIIDAAIALKLALRNFKQQATAGQKD